MQSINKVRIAAASAAIAVPIGLLALVGHVFDEAGPLLRHWFEALSPDMRGRAVLFGRTLPYWMPATVALFAAVVGRLRRRGSQRADREDARLR